MTESGLIGTKFNMTSADIIFSKGAEGQKLLQYKDFLWMLALVSEERGESFEQVAQRIVIHAPESSGTIGEYVPWHDDKSTFTGAHAARFGLQQRITDRKGWKHERPRPVSVDGVENAFTHLCRDAGLFGFAEFDETVSNEIFTGVANPGATTIGYVDFKWALDLSAERVSVTYEDLCITLLELGLGDDDAAAIDRDSSDAEQRWKQVEANNREKEVAKEMGRQRRLAETRRRRLESSGLPAGLPTSPSTPTRPRGGSTHASPRVSQNAQDVADVRAMGDGPAMKELKEFATEVWEGDEEAMAEDTK